VLLDRIDGALFEAIGDLLPKLEPLCPVADAEPAANVVDLNAARTKRWAIEGGAL
jgi:hypothetical protein